MELSTKTSDPKLKFAAIATYVGFFSVINFDPVILVQHNAQLFSLYNSLIATVSHFRCFKSLNLGSRCRFDNGLWRRSFCHCDIRLFVQRDGLDID